ncbi:pilus assembly protein [Marinobacter sp. 1-3A]|uniref:pilus assembly PilX family protein n=1 Tax=Marinobacter sp. 1-3A TaxID=2582920 RepID=UPI001907F8BF|nr:pilus assembly protein [Marinobacter sp. 1-3A]MBK1874668.1 pilus assembly protein [Marinobacter sp. 1-3A]
MMKAQSGNTLLVSLLLLLILTLVAVGSIEGVSLGQKMASNYENRGKAFQAAEAVLAEGERAADLLSQGFDEAHFASGCSGDDCFTAACNKGKCFSGTYSAGNLCTLDNTAAGPATLDATWASNALSTASTQNFPDLSVAPRYIIEFRCFVVADPLAAGTPSVPPPYDADWAYMYRISSLAVGANGGARVLLQSTYKVIQ